MRFLECPHCRRALCLAGGTVACERGHTFDVARAGYVTLLTGSGGAPGDTPAIIAAREAFLATGHYDSLARTIADEAARVVGDAVPGCVVDLGAGTGWYLYHILNRLPRRIGIAIDASKPALRRAARSHPHAIAVGCDIWQGLPMRTGAAALVVNVFAPRNPEEMARVLHPNGRLIVVTPTDRHLLEIRRRLSLLETQRDKAGQVDKAVASYFLPMRQRHHDVAVKASHADVRALVQMGPNAYHTDPDQLEHRIGALADPMTITVSVTVSTYRPR